MAKMDKIKFLSNIEAPNVIDKDRGFIWRDSTTIVGLQDGYYRPGDFVRIPTGVIKIDTDSETLEDGSERYYGWMSGIKIFIPKTVTHIASWAFVHAGHLSDIEIYCEATSAQPGWGSHWNYMTETTDPDGGTVDVMAPVHYGAMSYFDGHYSSLIGAPEAPRYSGEEDGLVFTLTDDGQGYSVSANSDQSISGDIRIPLSYTGLPVTCIEDGAFHDCSSLTSVTIPDSVTSIGSEAFRYCSSLTSVTLGNGIDYISAYAFCDCSSLTSVTIGNSVTSIGEYAFYDCRSLTSVTIGDGVTSIGSYAFYNCSKLTSVVIGDGVTSIGSEAFARCTGLTSVIIPDSVTSMGYHPFRQCTGNPTLYCEAASQPSGWGIGWSDTYPVVWGAATGDIVSLNTQLINIKDSIRTVKFPDFTPVYPSINLGIFKVRDDSAYGDYVDTWLPENGGYKIYVATEESATWSLLLDKITSQQPCRLVVNLEPYIPERLCGFPYKPLTFKKTIQDYKLYTVPVFAPADAPFNSDNYDTCTGNYAGGVLTLSILLPAWMEGRLERFTELVSGYDAEIGYYFTIAQQPPSCLRDRLDPDNYEYYTPTTYMMPKFEEGSSNIVEYEEVRSLNYTDLYKIFNN